jgi:DNA-directed RNA polymerase specialized sigma54-like protein
MRFETSQSMKLGQQMKLAPRMIQSMEILQMSLAELEERIEQELASNPTLELVEHEREQRDGERDDRGLERAGEGELDISDSARTTSRGWIRTKSPTPTRRRTPSTRTGGPPASATRSISIGCLRHA